MLRVVRLDVVVLVVWEEIRLGLAGFTLPLGASSLCYKVIQRFRVTGLFAGQHNT